MQDRVRVGIGGIVVGGVAVKEKGQDEGRGTIADNDGVNVGRKRSGGHNTRLEYGANVMKKQDSVYLGVRSLGQSQGGGERPFAIMVTEAVIGGKMKVVYQKGGKPSDSSEIGYM